MQDPGLVAAAGRAAPFIPQPAPLSRPVLQDGPGRMPTAAFASNSPSTSSVIDEDDEDIVNEAMRAATLAAMQDDDQIFVPIVKGTRIPVGVDYTFCLVLANTPA